MRELPVATKMAGVNMRLQPGGIREMHWHKEAEWGTCSPVAARVTLSTHNGRNFIADVNAGDHLALPGRASRIRSKGIEEGSSFCWCSTMGNSRRMRHF